MPRSNERLLARVMLGGTLESSGDPKGNKQSRSGVSIVEIMREDGGK